MKKEKLPKALYRGKLPIGNVELNCAVLDDETRILSTSSMFEALGRTARGLHKDRTLEYLEELNKINPNNTLRQVPPFLGSKVILSLIDKNLLADLEQIIYQDGSKTCYGYKASVLPEICGLYLKARREDLLSSSQQGFAHQAEILLESFAKVGITALIDEATGFQKDRKYDALRILLQTYIEESMKPWIKTFPDGFFTELDRLYDNPKTISRARPSYYGKFINTYIYNPIEDGYVKEELDRKNKLPNGKKKSQFHRWLTEFGQNQLILQIGRVLGAMETSPNLRIFKDRIQRQSNPTLFDMEELEKLQKK